MPIAKCGCIGEIILSFSLHISYKPTSFFDRLDRSASDPERRPAAGITLMVLALMLGAGITFSSLALIAGHPGASHGTHCISIRSVRQPLSVPSSIRGAVIEIF